MIQSTKTLFNPKQELFKRHDARVTQRFADPLSTSSSLQMRSSQDSRRWENLFVSDDEFLGKWDASIRDSNRDTPYQESDVSPTQSVSLYAWNQISKWRSENKNDPLIKGVAELGYAASAITGLVEFPLRMAAAWLVGNKGTEGLARLLDIAVGLPTGTEGAFLACFCIGKEFFNHGADQSAQAIAQNVFSLGTNLASHESNMKSSKEIKKMLEGITKQGMEILEVIHPVSIVMLGIDQNPVMVTNDIFNNALK